ncbi:hypothetical protein [Olsenella sp. An290]|uniref:hypothetical protein n=1 Tax=Olsenella sp. An290 TaxID=1965625 RepID=UPI000B399D82|nr:hypothetical protein [Olsenella sp. An290]OUO35301.1 hypothetical protein B5F84_03395 [Olsenella sp. An290]
MNVNKIMGEVRGKLAEAEKGVRLSQWPDTDEGRESAVSFLEAVAADVRGAISALKGEEG